MSTIIYLSSILAAIVWSFCYVLIETTPAIHFFLLVAFLGIMASYYMDEHKEISKQ